MPKIDLAYTPAEIKARGDMNSPANWESEAPKYPWGLEIHMGDETLSKLDKTPSDFKVGEELEMKVTVRVTGVSERETTSGSDNHVDMQIVAVERGANDAEKAKALYDTDDNG